MLRSFIYSYSSTWPLNSVQNFSAPLWFLEQWQVYLCCQHSVIFLRTTLMAVERGTGIGYFEYNEYIAKEQSQTSLRAKSKTVVTSDFCWELYLRLHQCMNVVIHHFRILSWLVQIFHCLKKVFSCFSSSTNSLTLHFAGPPLLCSLNIFAWYSETFSLITSLFVS